MRKLFLSALLLCSCQPAPAVDLYAENRQGGWIILSDRACPVSPDPRDKSAMFFRENGTFVRGCWSEHKPGEAVAAWENNSLNTYTLSDFVTSVPFDGDQDITPSPHKDQKGFFQ